MQGVRSTVAALPAGAKVTVVGITEDSFAAPYIILTAQLTGDEGYFKERLASGHAALMHAWQERSARLAPSCPETDILGALFVASGVFQESGGDHRQVAPVLFAMLSTLRVPPVPRFWGPGRLS